MKNKYFKWKLFGQAELHRSPSQTQFKRVEGSLSFSLSPSGRTESLFARAKYSLHRRVEDGCLYSLRTGVYVYGLMVVQGVLNQVAGYGITLEKGKAHTVSEGQSGP